MTRLVQLLLAALLGLFLLFISIWSGFNNRSEPTQPKEPKKPQAVPAVVDDDPGVKPDAQNPAARINEAVAALKSDPTYRFFKYEVWPGTYQKQKVWEIDYFYSERGLDGVFVLKHVAVYFRGGQIVGNSDPITAEQQEAESKIEEANAGPVSRSYDGSRSHQSDVRGHTEGQYKGGVGSSHKGGHYQNESTGNHYQSRKGG